MTHTDVILRACRETSEFAKTNAPTPRSIWNAKVISNLNITIKLLHTLFFSNIAKQNECAQGKMEE